MPKKQAPRNRNKSARHRAGLKAKHTKQRMRVRRELQKRRTAGRLRR